MFITKHRNNEVSDESKRVRFVLRDEITNYPFASEHTLDQLLLSAAIEVKGFDKSQIINLDRDWELVN
jgi:hypothetical protein